MQIHHPIVNYSSTDSSKTQKLTSTSPKALKKTPQKDQNQSSYINLLEFGAMSLLGGLVIKILSSQNITEAKVIPENFAMNHTFSLSTPFKFDFYKFEVCPDMSGAIKKVAAQVAAKVAERLKVCSVRSFSLGNREITIKNCPLSSARAPLAANELPSLFTNAASVFAEASSRPMFSIMNRPTWPLAWRNNSLNLKLQKGAKLTPEAIRQTKASQEISDSNNYLIYTSTGLLLAPLAAYGAKRAAQPAIDRLLLTIWLFIGQLFF